MKSTIVIKICDTVPVYMFYPPRFCTGEKKKKIAPIMVNQWKIFNYQQWDQTKMATTNAPENNNPIGTKKITNICMLWDVISLLNLFNVSFPPWKMAL